MNTWNTCDILMDMPQPPSRFSRRALLEIAPTVAALIATEAGIVTNAPQSIIFTGRLYEEGTPLRVALAFEQANQWHTMHPKMDWV
jgi:Asp-tRNA(Asn)/Glu-tRNA(Gln) amidotransferase A subunit family amidase